MRHLKGFIFLGIFLVTFFQCKAQEYVWSRKSIDSLSQTSLYSNWWGSGCNNCNGIIRTNGAWSTAVGRRNSTVDKDGNVYVIGTFVDLIKIGNTIITSNNSSTCQFCAYNWNYYCQDFYVAKYDSSGNAIWAIPAGGSGMDVANSISVDEQGYVYVAGTINGTNASPVYFGSIAVYPTGQDGFVGKISPSGQWVWAHKLTGLSDECATSVKTDRFGNVYVAGSGQGFIKVSSSITASTPAFNGGRDIFLAKIDGNGLPIWMKSGGSTEDDYPSDLATDNSGNIYLTANFRGNNANAKFGIGAGAVNLIGSIPFGGLIKYNTIGTPLWGIKIGTYTIAATTDLFGNTFITGVYNTTSTFGSTVFTPFSANRNDIFISKLTPSGSYVWTNRIGSDETAVVAGDCSWNGELSNDWPADIEVDGIGNVYVSGTLVDDSKPGSICMITGVKKYPYYTSGAYKRSGFVIKIKSDGSCGWNVRSRGYYGCYNENLNGIGLDNFGNLYFTGMAWIFPNYPLAIMLNNDTIPDGTLNSNFGFNAPWWLYYYYGEYIVRIRNNQVIYINNIDKSAYCVGDSMVVDYTKYGIFNSTNVFSLELSDSNGEFNNPILLGTKASNQSGQFRVKLPVNLLMGSGYRVRVNGNNPGVIGYPNNKFFFISVYPNGNAGPDQTICISDSILVTGTNGRYYEWSPASLTSTPNAASPYLKPTSTTSFVMRTFNPGNCSGYDTIVVSVVNRPSPQLLSAPNEICKNDTATFQTATVNALGVNWFPNYNITKDTGHLVLAFPQLDTLYKAAAYNAYCADTLRIEIKVNPLPVALNLHDSSICQRDSLAISFSSNAVSWNWTPNYNIISRSSGVPLVYPDSTVTYTLDMLSAKGCKKSENVKITVFNLPPIEVIQDTDICWNEQITLKAFGAIKYLWVNDAFITSSDTLGNVTIRPTLTKTYIVQGTDGRCFDTASVQVRVNALPLVDAGTDTSICFADTMVLRPSGAITYKWASHIALDDSTVFNPKASPSQTTWFKVTGTDGNYCVNKDSIKVVVFPLPIVGITPDTISCPGHAIQLSASGGEFYQWWPTTFMANSQSANPTVSPYMQMRYYVIVTDRNKCSKTDSILVKVRVSPIPIITGNTTICRTDTTILAATRGLSSYRWTPTNGLATPNVETTLAMPIITTAYRLEVKDQFGCEGSDTVTVNVLQLPDVSSVDDQTICQNDSVELSATSTKGISYQWSTGQTTSSITVHPDSTVQYFVRSFDGKCWSLPEPVSVKVEEIPNARLNFAPTEGRPPLRIKFKNTSSGNDIIGYLWDFGDTLGTSITKEPEYIYEKPGQYKVKLKVFTANGCYDEIESSVITVYDFSDLYVPTAFSPNADGINELFIIQAGEMKWMKVKIFNRWGAIIKELNWEAGQPLPSWDGNYLGVPVQDGAYVITIEAKGLDGKYRYYQNEITVIR
jgi:gliding motility-associated-like protein